MLRQSVNKAVTLNISEGAQLQASSPMRASHNAQARNRCDSGCCGTTMSASSRCAESAEEGPSLVWVISIVIGIFSIGSALRRGGAAEVDPQGGSGGGHATNTGSAGRRDPDPAH